MPSHKHPTLKIWGDEAMIAGDLLAIEEPLEIYIDDMPYAVTMRTPGDDERLVAGFCLSEGLIATREDLESIRCCEKGVDSGRIFVTLANVARKEVVSRDQRKSFASKTSCGVCGKTKLDEIYADIEPVTQVTPIALWSMQACLKAFEARQALFRTTGCTHSAAVFRRDFTLVTFAEDIGRHNALDKAIGGALLGSENNAWLAMVSSRLSFEMVQKAAVFGLEILAGMSAATSLAVRMAESLNITLIGFLRPNRMNVYTHSNRIVFPPQLRRKAS